MTDFESIDGLRLRAAEIQENRDLDVNVRVMAELVAAACAIVHLQGLDNMGELEKMVLYLKHLSTQRSEMWGTLEQLVDEVRQVREQLVDRHAELDAREADIERREQQLHENAALLLERKDIKWFGE